MDIIPVNSTCTIIKLPAPVDQQRPFYLPGNNKKVSIQLQLTVITMACTKIVRNKVKAVWLNN